MRLCKKIVWLVLTVSIHTKTNAQGTTNRLIRTLNVSNGLPQSVVTGIVQDSIGFIWIGTRGGLARFDGKKYKVFSHIPGDSLSMSGNTIAELYMGSKNRLWVLYETGDIDIINTLTESIVHLTRLKTFQPLYNEIKVGHTITEDNKENVWLLGENGLFYCNPDKQHLDFYPYSSLNLSNEKTSSIVYDKGNVVVVTNLSLTRFNTNAQLLEKIKYPPAAKSAANISAAFKNFYALFRQNGDAVIQCNNEIRIYNAADKSFSTLLLNETDPASNSMIMDNNGNVYLFYTLNVYYLSLDNKLTLWRPKEQNPKLGFLSILLDRSGVLWLGSNGDGVQLFDLRLSRFQGVPYEINFPQDVFKNYLDVSTEKISTVFSKLGNPFTFRWTTYGNSGVVIFTGTDYDAAKTPQVFLYKSGHITVPSWRYNDSLRVNHSPVYALACSRSGKIWGINFFMQPVYFDTLTSTAIVYKPIVNVTANGLNTTDLLIEGEDKFWITTAFEGLYFYDKQSGKTIHYTYSEKPGSLPTNQLIHIEQDARDTSVLWISSLGAGIIKFNKVTGNCALFTDRDGLPDNTVYAMVPDEKGIFWCSSNKGIFSFDPKTSKVLQRFTSEDGLPGDEFNRFHFFKFHNGNIGFGGVSGYTVFNPLTVQKDLYQPPVGFTGIEINNVAADFGQPSSPFKSAVNSLTEIRLSYDQNFLTFQFAAFEYNVPEKIKYRFILQNFDDNWVYAGNSHLATYTKLPPGNYTFAVNATNTSGNWSRHIKTVAVIIEPPFWKTWWFTSLWILLVVYLIYFVVRYRISVVRKEEQQKAAFEREALELKAEALELKAEALRAQMNPHFIFNSLNSIKSLIQKEKKQEAVIYLTTFSKLIRNQLNNARREISLHEELETCRLYTELEALRFGSRISCSFAIDDEIDTYSLQVPPLILQPFIENAIWHGILPKEGGNVKIAVSRNGRYIQCTIEDDGIGRESSLHNKAETAATYQSKGMKLVQGRLNLHNSIKNQGGTVEVIDKKDSQGNSLGTLVIVKFEEA